MKKDLLVTLADKNYIDQAKQLFSSVYFSAGWRGDYMLLAHEIPEKGLRWFRDKGILIKRCKKLYVHGIGIWPSTVLSKFYLFMPEFKKWNNIIYLDADIIVRASLDELTKIKGFAAVPSIGSPGLGSHFIKPKHMFLNSESKKIFNKLKRSYDLKTSIFNSGMMVFSTNIIKIDTFYRLNKLFEFYKVALWGEEPLFNLFFYKKWTKLALVYNVYSSLIYSCDIKPEKLKGIILHLTSHKIWSSKNFFYKELKFNLNRAELIDIKKIPPPCKKWTEQEIKNYSLYLEKRYSNYFCKLKFLIFRIKNLVDRNIGLMGIFLKKYSPRLYYNLKKLKRIGSIR